MTKLTVKKKIYTSTNNMETINLMNIKTNQDWILLHYECESDFDKCINALVIACRENWHNDRGEVSYTHFKVGDRVVVPKDAKHYKTKEGYIIVHKNDILFKF